MILWATFRLSLLPDTGHDTAGETRHPFAFDNRFQKLIRAPHLHLNLSRLIDDDKHVPTADHIPIAALPVPVAVLVRVPVGAVPVATGVHGGGARSPNSGRPGVGVICAISRSDGRATSGVNCRAIAGLHRRATSIMCDLPVFPLIGIRI
jgi:hypothetical protein